MKPKFRAYGRKDYRMSTEIEPKEMYYDVSVVTTFDDKKQHVITDFGMWNEEEYSGTELIDYDLMQSTGLFDSSLEPVEIYKDDIVTKSLPNGAVLVGVVTFTKGMFLVDGVEAIDQSWVVIGNIHEHPDLMEGLNGKNNI